MTLNIDKPISTYLIIGIFTGIMASCASSPPEEKKPTEPVKEPVVEQTEPILPSNPTDGWRTPQDDTSLPTDAQLADGAESSLGKAGSSDPGNNRPSTSIKPPPAEPEDQLAPSE